MKFVDIKNVKSRKSHLSEMKIFVGPEINDSKNILLGEMILLANGKTQPHVHDYGDEAMLLLSGQGFISVDGERFSVCAPQSWVIPRGCAHHIENTSESEKMIIIFSVSPLAPKAEDGHRNVASYR
jgi:quercetin dioxygenase-like cupin family protein